MSPHDATHASAQPRDHSLAPRGASSTTASPPAAADASPATSPWRLPSMASDDYRNAVPEWDLPPRRDDAAQSSFLVRLYEQCMGYVAAGTEVPFVGVTLERGARSLLDCFFAPAARLRPRTYVDAHLRPNDCPERHWFMPWRWPRFRYVNAKVPPPVNGAFNDRYHYLAFQTWLELEKMVYMAHTNHLLVMLSRCMIKEGEHNAQKNCLHLLHKMFAMTRSEEMAQSFLYMSTTGNVAIRETPYPDNYVEYKRKLYDDWLQRTRMRRPGDAA